MPSFHVAESALSWQVSLSRLPMVSSLQFHVISFIGVLGLFWCQTLPSFYDTFDTVGAEDSDS